MLSFIILKQSWAIGAVKLIQNSSVRSKAKRSWVNIYAGVFHSNVTCMHATCIADDTNNAEVTRVPAGLSLRARGPGRETVRVLPETFKTYE